MSQDPLRSDNERFPEDDEDLESVSRSREMVRVGSGRHAVMALREPESASIERLRRVAMQLMVGYYADDSRVLAVISPDSGDGRSFVASNLAVLFAQAGRRTLLIDGDLRSPVQHEMFEARNEKGLSNLARGRADWSVVQPVDGVPGLYIIPSGPAVSNPGEIVSRSTLAEVLDELQRPCDQIIIDTPPGGPFADGQALATHASAALMVMRRNRTRIKEARSLMDRVLTGGATVVGSLLNEY